MKAYVLKNKKGKCSSFARQLKEKVKTDDNLIVLESLENAATVAQLICKMAGEKELLVYNFESLSLGLFQYHELKERLDQADISITFLKEPSNFNETLETIYRNEKTYIRERTKRGLDNARAKGKIGGRPKVLEATQKEIARLYREQKLTLREIADKCNISVGTAYKYAITLTQ